MSVLFVTGAGTDIGKTYIACRLIEALRARGRAVEAFKPVVSGYDPEAPEASDPALLARALGRAASAETIAAIAPWRFAAPLAPNLAARREGRALRFGEILDACRARRGDPLLIEGAGGVMSPLDDGHTFLDLIAALGAPCVLIGGAYLGAVSHTLTALAALAARGVRTPCLIVNESAESVGLEETCATLGALAGGVPLFAVRRGGAPGEDALAWIDASLRQPSS